MLDFHKEQTPSGIRFTLPPRVATPKMRIMGGFLMVFGLAIALFACGWMWMPLQWALTDPTPVGPEASGHGMPLFFRIFFCAFAAFGLMPLGIGLAMSIAGLAFIIGGSYCRIDLEPHRLLVREQFAFLHWTFRRKIKDINALHLGSQEEGTFPGRDFVAQSSGKKALMIAPGYPIPLIRRLAKEIHREMPAVPLIDELPTPQAPLERFTPSTPNPVKAVPVEPSIPDPGPPPPGVLCDIRSHGVTLDVQAPGIWKGARFFLFFSTFWLFITAIVTIPMLFMVLQGKPIQNEDGGTTSPWFILPFLSIFWAVGLGMLAAAVHIGTRRTTIVLGDGLLALTITSRLRRWHQQWPLDTLREIKIGPSGASVNDRPIPCLHLLVGDKTIKILTAWNKETERRLEWICAILSTAPLHHQKTESTDMPSSLRCDPGQDDWAVVPVFVRKNNGAFSGLIFSLIWLTFVSGFIALLVFVFKIHGSDWFIAGSILGLFAVIGLVMFFWSLWSLNVHRRLAITAGRLSTSTYAYAIFRTFAGGLLCELG